MHDAIAGRCFRRAGRHATTRRTPRLRCGWISSGAVVPARLHGTPRLRRARFTLRCQCSRVAARHATPPRTPRLQRGTFSSSAGVPARLPGTPHRPGRRASGVPSLLDQAGGSRNSPTSPAWHSSFGGAFYRAAWRTVKPRSRCAVFFSVVRKTKLREQPATCGRVRVLAAGGAAAESFNLTDAAAPGTRKRTRFAHLGRRWLAASAA